MKGNIIATVGISASGKSSWAHEEWKKDPLNTVVINRDKIRELLFSFTEKSVVEYYSRKDVHKLEKEVTKYEDSLVYEGIEAGKTVIVDATHLKRSYIERFKYWNVPTEIKVFPVTLKEALTRDMGRVRQVGEEVITKQYNRFINLYKDLENNPVDFTPVVLDNDINKTPCVIVERDSQKTLHSYDSGRPLPSGEASKDVRIKSGTSRKWKFLILWKL